MGKLYNEQPGYASAGVVSGETRTASREIGAWGRGMNMQLIFTFSQAAKQWTVLSQVH
ncbi:hypothetical protein M569_00133 [Genlisea aurea]|uniref:Uncharacterized protein n=1 Tax=Genlisea aurea TaxID=192259 RepID=S8D4G8_9LAMI|nr:hypothetical protein M569_00133 [Genlisea aurea]